MPELTAELLLASECQLAEGIQWHVRQQRLWWTDIHGAKIWTARADGSDAESWTLPERVGCFAFDAQDNFVLALESGFAAWNPELEAPRRISRFESDVARTRFNDGRCDRAGRFLAGGVHEDGLQPHTSLQRLSPDGQIETLISNIGCANALAFSPDGTTMYFSDSPTRRISTYAYSGQVDSTPFQPESEREFMSLEDGPAIPDGSCVDAAGNLWNAEFNGYGVQCYLPDGTTSTRIVLPVAQVTCCCFGGPDMDELFISTAREHLTGADIAREPLAGAIFKCRPGGTGLPEDIFAGDALALADRYARGA